ncbi:MAG: ABC-F family ATP-binding cassette domain-containing protein [Rhizobiaceae bacterium]|nr:ABC-F family ATP-binding cassette domain-containing protein [Rhizobiaceae bacterium]
MLTISDLSARIAGRLLIDHASVTLPTGMKAGIVGRNGAGKSTLFRVITGDLGAETGDVSIPRNCRIGQVAQEAPSTEDALIDIVLAADEERTALMTEAETATDPNRIADIQMRLVDIDAHSAQSRAASILAGLGFDEAAQQRPASSFSGGWRMRVALAAILFSQPDLLLLDEPTNYLDLEGTLWLQAYIRAYPYTAIIISHDRDLLNNACNTIIHLDQKKLTLYKGNYDQFARQKAEQDVLQEKVRIKNEAARKHLQSFVDRFKAKASKAKQAQSRVKALEKMGTVASVVHENVSEFHFPDPEKAVSSPIIKLQNASCGYEADKPILQNIDLRIDHDDRIALLGMNGNGKSTFAKLISDRLQNQTGELLRVAKLNIGFFAQHQLDDLHRGETPYEHVKAIMPDAPEAKVRARVAQMGLSSEKMDTKVEQLSGGEKARLLMGLATFDGPHLLILDEPTNHLDIDSRASLIRALTEFQGAVILISHDRYLIEATVDRLWIVNNGTVKSYDGDMDEYRDLVVGGKTKAKKSDEDASKKLSKADQRKQAAQAREKFKPLKRKVTEIENKIEKVETKIAAIDAQLADPEIYEKDPAKVMEITKTRGELLAQVEVLEDEWTERSEEYESAIAAV